MRSGDSAVMDRARGLLPPCPSPPSPAGKTSASAPLRIVSLDESDHLADNQNASVASLRQLTGIPPEH
jgi:hypothetical protein